MFNPMFPRMTRPAGAPRPWFQINAAEGDGPAEIRIYDDIGKWWGLSAKDFATELAAIEANQITLRINSAGGDVFEGFAIYNILQDHHATITTIVDGYAASIASIVALAGDSVEVHEASVVMIHDPWGFAVGNAAELRDLADILDKKIAAPMAKIYADQMNLSIKDARKLMSAETWYTGKEAIEAGFASYLVDTGTTPDDAAASINRDLSGFRNPPGTPPGTPPAAGNGGGPDPGDQLLELMRRRLALQELED